jgi:hypothetical protein
MSGRQADELPISTRLLSCPRKAVAAEAKSTIDAHIREWQLGQS